MDRRKHIVVVDDDQAGAEMLRDFLTENGFNVSVAATARDGFRAILENVPDLIVLDLHLPDMRGSDLCDNLRKRPSTKDVPIILCTASQISREEKLKGYGVGADDYLVRPFDLAELLARISVLIRRSPRRRPIDEPIPDLPTAPASVATATIPVPVPVAAPPAPAPVPPAAPPQSIEKPSLISLVRRFASALLRPQTAFDEINPRSDMVVAVGTVLLAATAASLPDATKAGADFDSWIGGFSVAMVINILLWLSSSGLLALVLPFTGTVLPSRVALCAAGLAYAPRAVAAALSALYAVAANALMSGEVKPFSAGVDLIPGLPAAQWVEAVSHLSVFDVWAAYALLQAFRRLRPEGQRRWDGISILVGAVCLLFGALTRY